MRRVLFIVLVLSMTYCSKTIEPSEDTLRAGQIDSWAKEVQDWKTAEELSFYFENEVNRIMTYVEQGYVTYTQLNTTKEELELLVKKSKHKHLESGFLHLLNYRCDELRDGGNPPLSELFDALQKDLKKYHTTIEELGKTQHDIDVALGINHARLAEYVLVDLYRYPIGRFLNESALTPSGLVERFKSELEQANGYKADDEIYTHGPITVEHAQELADLAYQRSLDNLLTELRAKEYDYPDSTDMVNLVYKIMNQSGQTPASIGTTEAELEKLRRRVPENIQKTWIKNGNAVEHGKFDVLG